VSNITLELATAWIGDLLYRVTEIFDDYKAPLKTRGLFLIDEVDLHLHPKWQRAESLPIGESWPFMAFLTFAVALQDSVEWFLG
jgi:hypothetical protein